MVNDVRYDEYIARPGMTVVDYIAPVKKWILVHENPKGNSSSYGSHYPVYYRLADSPLEFDSSPGLPIIIDGCYAPNASPYVVWTPAGGVNGTIVVSDADNDQIYINTKGGALDGWEARYSSEPFAYSRALHIFEKLPDRLIVLGGAGYDDLFDTNATTPAPGLSLSVVSVAEVLKNNTYKVDCGHDD